MKVDLSESSDITEASALGYNDQHIDVYSNSWGPSDFGFFVDGPDTLVQRALQTAVEEVCTLKPTGGACRLFTGSIKKNRLNSLGSIKKNRLNSLGSTKKQT